LEVREKQTLGRNVRKERNEGVEGRNGGKNVRKKCKERRKEKAPRARPSSQRWRIEA
jgi:hypothetical protein